VNRAAYRRGALSRGNRAAPEIVKPRREYRPSSVRVWRSTHRACRSAASRFSIVTAPLTVEVALSRAIVPPETVRSGESIGRRASGSGRSTLERAGLQRCVLDRDRHAHRRGGAVESNRAARDRKPGESIAVRASRVWPLAHRACRVCTASRVLDRDAPLTVEVAAVESNRTAETVRSGESIASSVRVLARSTHRACRSASVAVLDRTAPLTVRGGAVESNRAARDRKAGESNRPSRRQGLAARHIRACRSAASRFSIVDRAGLPSRWRCRGQIVPPETVSPERVSPSKRQGLAARTHRACRSAALRSRSVTTPLTRRGSRCREQSCRPRS